MDSAGNLIDALIDRASPEKKAWLEKICEDRTSKWHDSIAHLEENCRALGITYVGDEIQKLDAVEIADAAETAAKCSTCTRNIMESLDCPVREKREDWLLNSYATRCEKFLKAQGLLDKKREQKRLLQSIGLGKRFATRTFETFTVTPETRDAYQTCREFCENYSPDSTGIRLMGTYGSGKTHLAAAIVHKMAEHGVGGMFVVVPELLRAIRRGYNAQRDNADRDADRLVNIAETSPLLVLDDLGAEKPSEWVTEQLYVIINRRYENMLPTIITTNCTTQELVSRIGQRTVSRLIEMTVPVKLHAKDYRMQAVSQ